MRWFGQMRAFARRMGRGNVCLNLLRLSPLIGAGIVLAVLVWQLQKLDPNAWCVIAVNAAHDAGRPTTGDGMRAWYDVLRACFDAERDIIGVYKQNTFALIVILGVTIIASVVTALKVRVEVNGPGGFGGRIGGDAGEG